MNGNDLTGHFVGQVLGEDGYFSSGGDGQGPFRQIQGALHVAWAERVGRINNGHRQSIRAEKEW